MTNARSITLAEGQKVTHLKTGNTYMIVSTEHLQRINGDWTPAIIYQASPATGLTFSRTVPDFLESFTNHEA